MYSYTPWLSLPRICRSWLCPPAVLSIRTAMSGRDQHTLLCETGHNDPEVLILRLQLAGSLCHHPCPEFTRVHCDWPALIHPGVTVGDSLLEPLSLIAAHSAKSWTTDLQQAEFLCPSDRRSSVLCSQLAVQRALAALDRVERNVQLLADLAAS